MNTVPDRGAFESFYAGKVPWDIGKAQQPFVAVADRVASPLLDAGCGTGENALFFAAVGQQVTGIDFVEEAIQRARRKAAERGLPVRFLRLFLSSVRAERSSARPGRFRFRSPSGSRRP